MIIFKSINKLNKEVNFKANIGFVPTMGSLHKGHISLINSSKKKCKKTLVSIFINPSQFNNKKDLKKYPKNYGKNTKEALTSGFFWGYEGLINNIIKKIIKKNGINFKIVLTGGYSYFFKNRLIKKAKIERDITMQGIIKVYKNFLMARAIISYRTFRVCYHWYFSLRSMT